LSHGHCVIHAIPGFFEPFASLSHLAAAAVGLVAAVPLIRLGRGCPIRRAAVSIYTFSVVAMLFISGSYHSLTVGGYARHIMQRLDYSAIWLLIAGTFTAIHGVMHKGRWRSWMLTIVWTLALTGCLLQVVRFDLFSGIPGLLLFLGMGWVGLLSIIKIGRDIGFRAVWPIWSAGIFYSTGAILEVMHLPTVIDGWIGPHEVFHVAVLTGIFLHWRFVRQVLTVHAPIEPARTAPVLAPIAVAARR